MVLQPESGEYAEHGVFRRGDTSALSVTFWTRAENVYAHR